MALKPAPLAASIAGQIRHGPKDGSFDRVLQEGTAKLRCTIASVGAIPTGRQETGHEVRDASVAGLLRAGADGLDQVSSNAGTRSEDVWSEVLAAYVGGVIGS